MIRNDIAAIIFIIFAPIIGGLISGIDGTISSRMKGIGHVSLIQPFLDFFKLLSKKSDIKALEKAPYMAGHLLFSIGALVMLALRQDFFLIVLMSELSWIFLLMYGFNSTNIFIRMAAKRGLFAIIACFPVMLLLGGAIYLITKNGFTVQDIIYYPANLLNQLPFVFVSIVAVTMIRQGKAPFDSSITDAPDRMDMSGGLIGELGGINLAIVQITRWINISILYAVIILFVLRPLWAGLLIALIVLIIQTLIENILPRMRYNFLYKIMPLALFGIAMINILWIALKNYNM